MSESIGSIGTLGNADVIGGIVVTIRMPPEALRADVAGAKQILTSAESNLVMRVRMTVDSTNLRAMAQAAITEASAGLTMNIPIVGVPAVGAAGGAGGGPVNGGGGGGGAAGFAAGAAGAATGGGVVATGQQIRSGFRAAAGILYAAEGGMAIVGGGVDVARAMAEGDPKKREEIIKEGEQQIADIPILGSLVNKIGYANYAFYSTMKNAAMGQGLHTDYGLAEETLESAKEQDRRTKITAEVNQRIGRINQGAEKITESVGLELASRGQTAQERDVLKAQKELKDFNEKTAGINTSDVVDAREALNKKLLQAEKDNQNSIASEVQIGQREINSVVAKGEESRLMMTHQEGAAQRVALKEGLDAQISELQEAIQKMRDLGVSPGRIAIEQGKLTAMQAAAQQQMAAFDQANNLRQSQIRAADQGTIRSAGYATSGNSNMADYNALYESYQGKIDAADARLGPGNAVSIALEKERNQALQKLQDAQKITGDSYVAAGKNAVLRASGDTTQAALNEFDEDTKIQRQRIPDSDKAQFDTGRGLQREALITSQGKEIGADVRSLDTRTQQAGARGQGENRLASVIGEIAKMQTEVIGAKPEERGKIMQTQKAELKGMTDEMLRPNQYATEWDPTREAPGGPSGEGGKESAKILEEISNYLQTITNALTGGGVMPTAK